MAGTLVPLVLIPRYTSLVGNNAFTTIGMDVTEYEKAILTFGLSNGIALGGAPGMTVTFEESTDQQTWTTNGGGPFTTPTPGSEAQYQPTITKRWFRISVTLVNAASAATVWCIGFLQQRES